MDWDWTSGPRRALSQEYMQASYINGANLASRRKDWRMRILRYGEANDNSSYRAIRERLQSLNALSEDLRAIIKNRRMPMLDPSKTPIIEQWAIETYMAPMLTGFIHDPDRPDPKASEWLGFTAPIELLSVSESAARSMVQWYRLGTPSPWAADSVKVWGDPRAK